MIIKVKDNLVERIDSNSLLQNEIDCLNALALSRRKGFHFIVGSRGVLYKLSNLSSLSVDSRAIFRAAYGEQTRWGNLLNKQSFIVTLCSEIESMVSSNISDIKYLNVPLKDFLKYNLDGKSTIVAEHLNDIRFYQAMISSYLQYKKITGVNLTYTKVLGGGNTTFEVVEEHYKSNGGVSMCILDSDLTHPLSLIGDTAQQVLDIIPSNDYARTLILKSREVENIIPFILFEKMFKEKRNKALVSKFKKIKELNLNGESPSKYVDFKKGIKLSLTNSYGCKDSQSYWTTVLTKSEQIKSCTCKNPKCTCQIIDGFGSDLLKSCVKHIDEYGFNFDEIDPDTRLEWNHICSSLLPYMISPLKRSA